MCRNWPGWALISMSTRPRRWCAACRTCTAPRSWRPICAPPCRWSSQASRPRAKPPSTASTISTAAMSGSKRSWRSAAPESKGCAMPPEAALRLRAEDAEDLAIISACLQDALVSVRDLAYDRDARSFVLVANRFCWENSTGGDGKARFERSLCGLVFDGVDRVAYRGFHRSEEDRILSLLAIRP